MHLYKAGPAGLSQTTDVYGLEGEQSKRDLFGSPFELLSGVDGGKGTPERAARLTS